MLRAVRWIQTWHPLHPLYAARRHDFAAFAARTDARSAGLPPFAHLAMLRAGAQAEQARIPTLPSNRRQDVALTDRR